MNVKPTIILMDVNNALHRYFHTLPPRMMNGQRVETAAGVIGLAKKLQNGFYINIPEKLIAVADHKAPTFRHLAMPSYKAEREEHPEELNRQEEMVHQALQAYGIPLVKKSGVEADDSMGMLANYYAERGYYVIMVTTDKDMYQLINDNIHIWHPQKKQIIDQEGCENRLLVAPDKVADLLALTGDTVDGITGLHNVGNKTAAKWLNTYDSLKNLIEHADEIKGKVGETLRAGIMQVSQNIILTTIAGHSGLLTPEELDHVENHKPNPEACKMISSLYGIKLDDRVETAADLPPTPPIEAYANDHYANDFRF